MMKDLRGRVAVITGGGSGMGRSTGKSLARRGSKVVLVDLNQEGAEEAAKELRAAGGEAVALGQDIGAVDAFDRIKAFAESSFGPIDILMNNAAMLVSGSLEDVPFDVWETVINVNLTSMARAIKLIVPEMVARGSGHVVNTASFAALFPYAYDRMSYAATKAAVVSMSETLALYAKPRGVGVTLLLPGPVKTGIGSRAKRYSPHLGFRGPGPEFEPKESDDVGEQVAKAIEEDIFFLPTDRLVLAKMQARAADPEAFIAQQIAEMQREAQG
jgi:NAD(P)-dependent dehydrogenase (short-subunit alcohol dehydrogenase family)